ncbi:hypothetical protein F511_34936 [Dorcoceras hygrometricum]|uniref:Uncharacterized protein n=1 Tax=Dorcoceras hygrometricum TaxID=472368 RepID=A0A2Z7A4P2_9LAMI|nr:hypothetical protein F511_34936 [Dorcoceras hygrometricum]
MGETQNLLGGQLEQPSSSENSTQFEGPSINNEDHANNLGSNPILEENNTDHQGPIHLTFRFKDAVYGFQSQVHGFSTWFYGFETASPHTSSKLEEVEKNVASLDSRIMSIDSRMLSMDSKVKSMDSRLGSMDSKLEQLLNLHSFLKHEIGTSRRTFYDKIDTSTRCVLGKWVYLVTHAMSLFDLQDVCMVIGSLATLELPMVVDLIGIFVLKGSYFTLTMTDWFLQALSVIPRGSWDDVARRFTMIRWGPWGIHLIRTKSSSAIFSLPLLSSPRRRRLAIVARCRRRSRTCSDRSGEENPSVKSSLCFLEQNDKGIGIPVVDRIRRPTQPTIEVPISSCIDCSGLQFLNLPLCPGSGIRIHRCAHKSDKSDKIWMELTTLEVETRSEQSQAGQGKTSSEHSDIIRSWFLCSGQAALADLLICSCQLPLTCSKSACSSYSAGHLFELVPQLDTCSTTAAFCFPIDHPTAGVLDQVFSSLIWFTSSSLFFSSRAIVCLLVRLILLPHRSSYCWGP